MLRGGWGKTSSNVITRNESAANLDRMIRTNRFLLMVRPAPSPSMTDPTASARGSWEQGRITRLMRCAYWLFWSLNLNQERSLGDVFIVEIDMEPEQAAFHDLDYAIQSVIETALGIFGKNELLFHWRSLFS
jgi:hypothetical protein